MLTNFIDGPLKILKISDIHQRSLNYCYPTRKARIFGSSRKFLVIRDGFQFSPRFWWFIVSKRIDSYLDPWIVRGCKDV